MLADADQVTAELEGSGVQLAFVPDGSGPMWSASFVIEGEEQPVFMFVDDAEEYFILIASVRHRLKGSINDLQARVLAALIRTSSSVKLAKLEYLEASDRKFFAAVSECSVDGWTSTKIRRRMQACAELAVGLRKQLAGIPSRR